MSEQEEIPAKRPRRATAQTVADAAGVSRSAVSRAFTPGAYLDAEKRSRIIAVAADLGYQPNALAAGLKDGRSHLVAILMGNIRSPYDTAFMSALVGDLNRLNKWPIVVDGGGNRTATAIAEVLRYPLDALIVRGGSMSEDLAERCAKFGVPMISSGRPVTGDGVDNVCCRNADGTRMATEALLAKGRRRFGFLGGPEDFYSSQQRRNGVVETLAGAGLSLTAERKSDYTVEGGHAAAAGMVAEHALDALICANDAMAIGALSAAREGGVAVPDDLSIVGFDDIAMARWPMFRLSTVHNPIDASIAGIITLLERRLADPSKASETIYVKPVFTPRGTH